MKGHVHSIWVHPVKGLTPHAARRVTLEPGVGIAGDRGFALLFADAGYDGDRRAAPFTKKNGLAVQNDWPALAALACELDAATRRLRVSLGGSVLVDAAIDDEDDCRAIDTFFTRYIAAAVPAPRARHPVAAPVRFVGSLEPGATRYPDRPKHDVSLVNMASAAALAETLGRPVDIRRFRGNVVLEGLPAWAELDWVGREITVGGARLVIDAPIVRCPNTSVDPDTGDTSLDVLGAVGKSPGKGTFGLVATVLNRGEVAVQSPWAIS